MIVIVGGGTAGITMAARLIRAGKAGQITLIEPSEKHYYQPLWTLVGGGITTVAESLRQEKDLIPAGVTWVKEKVASFQPEKNQVTLASGKTLAYDYLIVAPGIQIFKFR